METLQITKKNDYAIIKMNRGKVNALNQQMVTDIRTAFRNFEADDSVRGVILTGIPNIFSAGLDLIELYKYDEEQIRNFFIAFGSMHIEMVQFSKPFICAITGHSPAGGAVLAIAADYRVMAQGEKYTIGLNEVAVNIQISQNLVEAYAFWIGKRKAHQCVLEGKLLHVDEALNCGLIDEVCPLEDVLPRAEKKMQHYLKADNDILVNTKYKTRKTWLDSLDTKSEVELQQSIDIWWKPEVRARMQMFISMLGSKKQHS